MPFQPITAPAAAEPVGLAAAVGVGVVFNEPSPDPLDPNGDWTRGYTLAGEVCGAGRYVLSPRDCDADGNLLEDVPDTDSFSGFEAGVDGRPIMLGAGVKCGTFYSPKDLGQWQAVAQRRLELCQWSDLAEELWTGDKAKLDQAPNRHLTGHDADIVATGAQSVVNGIAEMDASFGSCTCGGPRVIHVPTYLMAHLKAKGVVERIGNRYYTPSGSLIVWDDGYKGTGPDTADYDPDTPGAELRAAPAAGTAWIYGTTQVVAKMAPVRFPGGEDWQNYVDYRTNDVIARAERLAMASWLCCHLAVLISTTA